MQTSQEGMTLTHEEAIANGKYAKLLLTGWNSGKPYGNWEEVRSHVFIVCQALEKYPLYKHITTSHAFYKLCERVVQEIARQQSPNGLPAAGINPHQKIDPLAWYVIWSVDGKVQDVCRGHNIPWNRILSTSYTVYQPDTATRVVFPLGVQGCTNYKSFVKRYDPTPVILDPIVIRDGDHISLDQMASRPRLDPGLSSPSKYQYPAELRLTGGKAGTVTADGMIVFHTTGLLSGLVTINANIPRNTYKVTVTNNQIHLSDEPWETNQKQVNKQQILQETLSKYPPHVLQSAIDAIGAAIYNKTGDERALTRTLIANLGDYQRLKLIEALDGNLESLKYLIGKDLYKKNTFRDSLIKELALIANDER